MSEYSDVGVIIGRWRIGLPVWRGSVTIVPDDEVPKPIPDELREAGRRLDTTPLIRVVPVEAEREQNGVWIGIPWLELRHGGFRFAVHVRTSAAPVEPERSVRRQLGPIHAIRFSDRIPAMAFPVVDVDDDLGTDYRIVGAGGGGDWPAWTRQEFSVVPAPPAAAQRFIVSVKRIAGHEFPGEPPPVRIEGPWRFEVPLR